MPIRRIVLFAASGAYNLGDEAIVRSEIAYLRERYPEARISVSTYDPRSTLLPESWNVRHFSYFPNGLRKRPFRNLAYLLRTVWEIFSADLAIIGGGGIFYDNESGQSFPKQVFEWRIRTGLAWILRKRVLFWGIGVDVRPENVRKLVSLFSSSRVTVTVRDSKSAEILASADVPAKIVPDPAFLMPPIRKHIEAGVGSSNVAPLLQDTGPAEVPSHIPAGIPVNSDASSPARVRKVGISIRDGSLPRGTEDVESIIKAVRNSGFSPVFLNTSFHPTDPELDDRSRTAEIAEREGIPSTKNLHETLDAFGQLDAVVAMRLHAGLLAFVNAIPCFVLSYSKKTDALAKKLDCEWLMDAKRFDAETFDREFRRFSEWAAHCKPPFFANADKCAIIRKEARILYDEVFYGLERTEK